MTTCLRNGGSCKSIWSGMIGGQTDADLDPGVGDIQDQQRERVMLIYYLKEVCLHHKLWGLILLLLL